MPGGIGTLSLPFGPSTRSWSPTCSLTPLGSGIGFFPTLDMMNNPSMCLPDLAEELSANAFLARSPASHDTFRRRQNIDPESAEHPRNLFAAHVSPAARTRHAFDVRDSRLVGRSVLQIDLQYLRRTF